MRTRFLNVDYLSAFQSPAETLSFLNLPPLHFPPHASNFSDNLLHFDSFLNLPLQTERLPIDAALSNFLSKAIPPFIDVDIRDFKDTRFPSGNASAKFSAEEEATVCTEKEEDNVTCGADKDVRRLDVILFETPEMDTFLDNAHFSEKEIETFYGISEIVNSKLTIREDAFEAMMTTLKEEITKLKGELTIYKAVLGNKGGLNTFFDTGASDLLMSEETAHKLGLKIQNESGWIKTVNSESVPIKGVTKEVDLQLGDWTGKATIRVIPLDDYNFMVGLSLID
ncbi:hypothetical protein GOBAR_AA26258 [Gossypium barbadense]|uniref:Uncharacterized protein n=1 Tax=Gossypium barbadense TaxID=3634 RepID=A0A2P5WTJ1_GOSBA|nr:hypothetical protein GOBAR_AA26258 [Gossypium barbadense]